MLKADKHWLLKVDGGAASRFGTAGLLLWVLEGVLQYASGRYFGPECPTNFRAELLAMIVGVWYILNDNSWQASVVV